MQQIAIYKVRAQEPGDRVTIKLINSQNDLVRLSVNLQFCAELSSCDLGTRGPPGAPWPHLVDEAASL